MNEKPTRIEIDSLIVRVARQRSVYAREGAMNLDDVDTLFDEIKQALLGIHDDINEARRLLR